MALTIHFTPSGMTREKYDEIIRRLEQAGEGRPSGRLYHSCYGNDTALRVTDVWQSPEQFQAFGQTLFPILADVGVDVGEPEIAPVHNLIPG